MGVSLLRGALVAGAVLGFTLPAHADTFSATGAEQSYTVPAGATSVSVTATASAGGGAAPAAGGRGAVVSATLPATPGQTLFVEVGGRGSLNSDAGFNGGAQRQGGGASDVRTLPRSQGTASLNSRLLVAGGGGGAASIGIAGGDADGGQGVGCGGGPGTQTAGGFGGAAGRPGIPGSLGAGGDGALGDTGSRGGGGGGGLFGGGGGGSTNGAPSDPCGGGGGGSSLVPSGGTRSLATTSTPASVAITAIAADAGGAGGGGGSGAGGPDTTKPSLTQFTLAPSRFVAANSGGPTAAAVGGRVNYRLSEAATVTFTVERKTKGRKKGRSCVKATPKNRGAKKCDRYVKQNGSFTHAGTAGLNSFRFQGRLGRRALPRGSYRLVGIAKDAAGNTSSAVRRSFSIVKG